ncbi:hypothetical protein ACOMHN_028234 [Nucella lapillus]
MILDRSGHAAFQTLVSSGIDQRSAFFTADLEGLLLSVNSGIDQQSAFFTADLEGLLLSVISYSDMMKLYVPVDTDCVTLYGGVQILDRSGHAAFQTLVSSGIDQRSAFFTADLEGLLLSVNRSWTGQVMLHSRLCCPAALTSGQPSSLLTLRDCCCQSTGVHAEQYLPKPAQHQCQPYLSAVLCLHRCICAKCCCEMAAVFWVRFDKDGNLERIVTRDMVFPFELGQ